jgi:transposase
VSSRRGSCRMSCERGSSRCCRSCRAAPITPGRKRLDDRRVLSGILFVLYSGIPWEFLPQELGFGSGMTCWRRLRDWHQADVWRRPHESLLAELHAARVRWIGPRR